MKESLYGSGKEDRLNLAKVYYNRTGLGNLKNFYLSVIKADFVEMITYYQGRGSE